MRIAIASIGNPRSVKTWSGIPFHIVKAFEAKGYQVIGITLECPADPWYYDWKRRINYRLQRKWFLAESQAARLKKVGVQLDKEVANLKPDIVIIIHGDPLAYTTFTQPAFFIHDTTFAGLVDYYAEFSNLTLGSIRSGNRMYKLALNRADAAIFSSNWASMSAVKDYKVSQSKVFTVPLGANLKNVPAVENVEAWIDIRSRTEVCKFLFLGVDWERKGGPDALRFIEELNRLGVPAKLMIAGCSPKILGDKVAYVEQFGFLSKDLPVQAETLERLLRESSALLVPSLAECYGCVYCEANAYGLPAIGRDTGGVSEIIKDGVNGLLLEFKVGPEALALRWKALWDSKEKYKTMSYNARKEFNERLNYDVFISKVEDIISSRSRKLA